MTNIIYQITKSSFVKNVVIMATGTAGAQAVSVALSPIITRLYGPEAFGIMGMFTTITRIIIPIAALTYPIAIVLPKNDKNAIGLMKLSMYITVLIATFATIILFVFNDGIIKLFHIEEIGSFLYLIPLVIVFASSMQILEQWLIRTNQFSVTAKAHFLQSIMTNGSKAGMGFIYPKAVVLVLLQALSNGLRALIMVFYVKKSDYQIKSYEEEPLSIKKLARKHKDFPLYRAPEEFFSSLTQGLPILLLTSLFGPVSAGFYNIGRTVLGLPSRLIGKAIGDVFYPRISEAANKGENLSNLIMKSTFGLGIIGIIPFGLVIAFGPYLFEFVFGSGWDSAGEYARWIALNSFAVLINKPSIRSIPVLSAQRFQMLFTIFRLIIRTAFFLVGFIFFESDVVAVALFGISGAFLNILLILIILNMSRKFN